MNENRIRQIIREELVLLVNDLREAVEHMKGFIKIEPGAVAALDIVVRHARNGLEERNENE